MTSITQKLKTVAVKCQPPRYTRAELLEKTNIGFAPKHQIGMRGIGQSLKDSAADRRRYGKGFARMKGWCLTCEHFKAKDKPAGKHCRLRESEHCVK